MKYIHAGAEPTAIQMIHTELAEMVIRIFCKPYNRKGTE
jgi:hypothetical protein